MAASTAQSVNILDTFNTYQYIIYISAIKENDCSLVVFNQKTCRQL